MALTLLWWTRHCYYIDSWAVSLVRLSALHSEVKSQPLWELFFFWSWSFGGLGIFLFTTASRPALGPTQSPIQWVPRALSLGVKRPRCEADHSPPSSVESKECMELYIHSPDTPSLRVAQFKKSTGTTLSLPLPGLKVMPINVLFRPHDSIHPVVS
jgi:hypothetical protein